MSVGGNESLREFFQQYNLLDEETHIKYGTLAANYYQRRLFAQLDLSNGFQEIQPSFDAGREMSTYQHRKIV